MPRKSSELDLRHYLEFVRGAGKNHFAQVSREISPRWQMAAVVAGLAQRMRSPVIRFNNVQGSSTPVVTNVCCSFDRVARGAGISADELTARLVTALDNPVEPLEIDSQDAPVMAQSMAAHEFSLRDFPQLFYTDTQTDPYLTAAILVARDPDSGAHNLSYHRLMISGDHEATIYMTPGGDLDRIWRKNRDAGHSTPVAAVLGTHPLWAYGSLAAGPLDTEDYGVVGAVLGEPLALCGCRDFPELKVPALSEIVLEGCIEAVDTGAEGPFGEFLGFVAEREQRPVVRFSRKNQRPDPLFQDIVAGQAEHMTMSSVTMRARLSRDYFRKNPAIADFWVPAAMTLFLAIDPSRQPDFDAPATMRELLQKERYLKQIVCFDPDVDLRKLGAVQAAISNNVQADRDVVLIPGCPGNGVDPSERDGVTCKMAIDARCAESVVTNMLPDDVVAGIVLNEWIDAPD